MMTWTYNGEEIVELPSNVVGFVYVITNLTNNRRYIGKKLAKFSKTKIRVVTKKNGVKKKKKIREKIDSDWLTYYGSSEELHHDINTLGKENFSREIIRFCESKAECSYFENYYIFQSHALLSPHFYNSWTSCKIHRSHLKYLTTQLDSGMISGKAL